MASIIPFTRRKIIGILSLANTSRNVESSHDNNNQRENTDRNPNVHIFIFKNGVRTF